MTATSSNEDIKIGDLVIFSKKIIGQGAFGTVFEGQWQQKPCAAKMLSILGNEVYTGIKVTQTKRAVQEEALSRFIKECDFMKTLHHPNIVTYYDTLLHPESNLPVLVMELMYKSLREYLTDPESLSERVQVSICYDVAAALEFIHSKDLIHRDLCGDNILMKLSKYIPVAKVTDFGMSRLMINMTHSLTSIGNRRGYLPPEAPEYPADYDLSLDIFMFGAVMTQIAIKCPVIKSQGEREKLVKELDILNHPLYPIVCQCLNERKESRPKASTLCARIRFTYEAITLGSELGEEIQWLHLKELHSQAIGQTQEYSGTMNQMGHPHGEQQRCVVPHLQLPGTLAQIEQLLNYEQTVSNNPRPNTSMHYVQSNVPYGQHQVASMVRQNPQPSMPQNMPQSQNVHYTTTRNPQANSDRDLQAQYRAQFSFFSEDLVTFPSISLLPSPQSSNSSHQSSSVVSTNNMSFTTPMDHWRHTEHLYQERNYPDDIDEDIDVFEGYEEYDGFQTEPRRNQVSSHFSHQSEQFYDPYYARQSVEPDPRNTDNYPSDGRDQRTQWQQEYAPGQGHTYHQASSKSDSVESAVSIESPNAQGSQSGPAETYDEKYISQNKEDFVKALGKSVRDQEYSAVLLQPEFIEDLNTPWTAIFAVFRRHPNCITALLENLRETKYYSVALDHISIIFDEKETVELDIPYEEATKQGYRIAPSVKPFMITKSEASPPHEGFGAKADSIYPQRYNLTIHPQQMDDQVRYPLNLTLKLIGAKDCGKHFVLRSPQLKSPDRAIITGLHSRSQVHTQPQLPPLEESSILEDVPNETTFAHLVGQKLAPRWKDFGTYLGVKQTNIQVIDKQDSGVSSLCQKLISVFNHWKNNKTGPKPTWKDLIAGVKRLDENLAQEMEIKLCSGQT